MRRVLNKLTATEVKNAGFDGKARKLFDGGGLYLHLKKSGKYWRMKYHFADREKLLSIGVYPEISLADARMKRAEARELIVHGIDPSLQKQEEREKLKLSHDNSFAAVAREWWEEIHRHNVVEAHSTRNMRRLEMYAFPSIGSRPIADLSPMDIVNMIRAIESKGSIETAKRVKILCGQVFRYAIPTGRAERDITADLKEVMRHQETKHHPALTEPEDIAGLMRAIDGYQGHATVMNALKFAPLVFVRPGELHSARWEDFNLEKGEWNFKPSKKNRPFITSLPAQAIKILEDQSYISHSSEWVFPSVRSNKRHISNNTLNGAIHSLGYKGRMTAHGFRAMARTVLAERLEVPIQHIEMQLAHAVKDANGRAYNRTTYYEQRKEMLQKWADYLDRLKNDRRES